MTDYKEKLREFTVNSALGLEQKKLWDIFLAAALPDEAEAVYEAVSEEKGNLELLTGHLRDKIWEIKERDQRAWEKLTADEKGFAEGLESKEGSK